MLRLVAVAKVLVGLAFIAAVVCIAVPGLLVLLPWRRRRIELTNALGSVMGAGIMKISGCRVSVTGQERLSSDSPAIYAGNHTSIYDAFTTIWLTPKGTVGVAKKEIIYYPFYGLCWWLAGHLLIDRANTDAAKAQMRRVGELVRRHRLHVCMMPEGRRSRDARLLPFKKGIVHLAIQTRLPIVPMVTVGAHRAWDVGTLTLRGVPIDIQFLPAVPTEGWSEDRIDEHLETLHRVFREALPPAQQPLDDPS